PATLPALVKTEALVDHAKAYTGQRIWGTLDVAPGPQAAILQDGSAIVLHEFHDKGRQGFTLTHLRPDGSVDQRFGDHGTATNVDPYINEHTYRVASGADGKIEVSALSSRKTYDLLIEPFELRHWIFSPDGALKEVRGVVGPRLFGPGAATGATSVLEQ